MAALNMKQQEVVNFFVNKDSTRPVHVLLTGPAGTGKSHIVREVLRNIPKEKIRILGSTGAAVAALGVEATTIHSFAGIGTVAENPTDYLKKLLKSSGALLKRASMLTHLIIEEISMTDGEVFLKLDLKLRAAKKKSRCSFGGVNVMLVGDYFQLPPVFSDKRNTSVGSPWSNLFSFEVFKVSGFCPHVFRLSQILRQDENTDSAFISALSLARTGTMSYEAMETLQACQGVNFPLDGVLPTSIMLSNRDVDKENTRCVYDTDLEVLVFRPYLVIAHKVAEKNGIFRGVTRVSARAKERASVLLLKSDPLMNPKAALMLRKGAQVMFRRNLCPEGGVINGTRGVVMGWVEQEESLSDQCLVSFPDEVKEPHATWKGLRTPVPVIYVPTSQRRYVVHPMATELGYIIEDGAQLFVVAFYIPLSLAYAVTAHKAQGLTLDRVKFDCRRRSSFIPPSIMYVIFSRCKSSQSIAVEGKLNKRDFWVHPRVRGVQELLEGCTNGTEREWPDVPLVAEQARENFEALLKILG